MKRLLDCWLPPRASLALCPPHTPPPLSLSRSLFLALFFLTTSLVVCGAKVNWRRRRRRCLRKSCSDKNVTWTPHRSDSDRPEFSLDSANKLVCGKCGCGCGRGLGCCSCHWSLSDIKIAQSHYITGYSRWLHLRQMDNRSEKVKSSWHEL